MPATPFTVEQIQQRAKQVFSNLESLAITPDQWVSLTKKINKTKTTKLNSGVLLRNLSDVTQKPYDLLVELLSKTHEPPRSSRTKTPITAKPASGIPQLRHHRPYNSFNPLVMKTNDTDSTSSSPTRVRRAPLVAVNTPSHKPIPLHESPGETRYRQVYSANGQQLFFPNTPSIPRFFDSTQTPIHEKIPKLHYNRPASVSKTYRVTEDQINARSGTRRHASQRQLTGASALDIFKAEGASQAETAHGREFHWSHLIAYFLGGNHDAENLVPTTAAANYNILDAIERIIPERLHSSQKQTTYVDVEVTLRYDLDASLIPVELIYKLTWKEHDITKSETHYFKPNSSSRYTTAMLDTFAALRDDTLDSDDDLSSKNQPPAF